MPGFVLTEEGRRYLKNGLPEKRLAELVADKPISIDDARSKVEDFSIALQWAKRRGWVRIAGAMISRGSAITATAEEELLRRASSGEELDEKEAGILVRRRLAEREREDDLRRAKRLMGTEIDRIPPELIKTGLWKDARFKKYNVSASGKKLYPGRRHPYNQFLQQVRQMLVELGFREMTGPIIETEFWNFDALYQPQNHPSRDWAETYTLKTPARGALPDKGLVSRVRAAHEHGGGTGSTGWGYRWDPKRAANLMPRAHGTACSARKMADRPEIPGKYFAMVRCFRPDVIDATHGVEFNQVEGIVIGREINFKHLLGILKQFAAEIAGAREVRFFADYYPFTEPSAQLSAKHPQLGWIEFGGAGIFRKELTTPLGVKEPVIAWGLGIDRLAMFKLGINDIRGLFTRDLSWLREERMIRMW